MSDDIDPQVMSKIKELCLELGEIESEIELATSRLKFQRDTIRKEIEEILLVTSYDSAKIPGFGSVNIIAPSVAVSYDKTMLDKLIAVLRQSGDAAIADDIEACRKFSPREGNLRITKDNKR